MRKKISILIISGSGKLHNYTISHTTLRILLGIFICIFLGTIWLISQYGSIISKDLKIMALRRENQKMREKYNKLGQFESEFNQLKHRILKIANALYIKEVKANYPKASFTQKDTIPKLTSIMRGKEKRAPTIGEQERNIPSIYPVKGWITQRFSLLHPAVDFAAELGTPVFSTMNGKVERTGDHPILGKIVEISNENGFKTVYGHLSRSVVAEGIKVKCGDLIGYVGTTGESSAPHLHYEVKFKGVPQNPERYLPK